MHIPNGFLSDPVCAATTAATVAAVAASVARMRQQSQWANGPLLASTGAAVFAAQMVNFNVDHSSSGHLLGAGLAAIVLGPSAGVLAMAVVLLAQCLMFGDGGLTALGANVLNMGVVACLTSYGVYGLTRRAMPGKTGAILGAGLGACGSVMAAATACSLELAGSGTSSLSDTLSAMLGVHAVVGAVEGMATAAFVALLTSTVPSALADPGSVARGSSKRLASTALLGALAIAIFAAPLASSAPDGLEKVALTLGFADLAGPSAAWAVAPDYATPGVAWQPLAIALAGLLGVAVVYAASYAIGRTALCKAPKRRVDPRR